MRVYLEGVGDSSVGIRGTNATLEIEGVRAEDFCFASAEGRKGVREDLQKYFSKLLDDSITALFDDECVECLEILDENGKCSNEHCCVNVLKEPMDYV